jgi:acetaldehyde dehydrogenase
MVTCGGQVSIPILKYITSKCYVEYAEVITQISSESAGLATRINIDKYIDTTELAINKIINIPKCKVILNINPNMNTKMQTTIFVKTNTNNDNVTFDDLNIFIEKNQTYIKNYKIKTPIWLAKNLLMTHITITSSGDTLSEYSGNLDIINCAAVDALKTIYKKST